MNKIEFGDGAKLKYSHIDFIFNHKNIWCNMRNHDPCAIYYHIHMADHWLPLIRDLDIPIQKEKTK